MAFVYIVFQRAHSAAIDARRRASTAGYLVWASLAGLTLGVSLAALLAMVVQLWLFGLWILAISMLSLCIVPSLAPWLTRHVLVPRGSVRTAYHAGRFSVVAGTDPQAYALVAAAWAVAGSRRPVSGDEVAWVQEKREQRGVLGDAEIVATAFLLARTDPDAARQLLKSVREMKELHPAVRELSGEWLAVDAAERGAWAELLPYEKNELGREAVQEAASPLRFFLEGVAATRLGHASAPSRFGLWARWLLAPHRRQTRALLERQVVANAAGSAGSETNGTSGGASDDAADPSGSTSNTSGSTSTSAATAAHGVPCPAVASLGEAVTLHVASLSNVPDAAGMTRLAESWDRALAAPETMAWLDRRALELGAAPGAAELAASQIIEAVASELRATIERQRLPTPPSLRSRFGQLLGSKLRHGRLDELELLFTRWADRVDEGQKLRPIDEWREFLAVRTAYEDLVASGGNELRRLAFPHVFVAVNQAAVALWNQRQEYAMAHAILAWELVEAHAVGDAAAIELAAKNVGLSFSTRTGQHE